MSEDDITKDFPNEDAPPADPLPSPNTAPLLEQILAEVIETRDTLRADIQKLSTELSEVKKDVRHIRQKPDVVTNRQASTDADVLDLRERVEKLEGERL